MKKIEIPQHIKSDVSKTGYEILNIHSHGVFYIMKIKKNIDMNWDVKDFNRFSWVVGNGGMYSDSFDNTKEFKLKIKF